jgi:hypothetical protein
MEDELGLCFEVGQFRVKQSSLGVIYFKFGIQNEGVFQTEP